MAKTQGQRDRRADLLEATRRAVITHGTDVKLSQIAHEAGLTSGAVLYHYPDVQALILEANRAGSERFYETRMQAAAGTDDPVEKLVLTISSGLPLDQDDDAVKLMCALGGSAARNPVYGAILTALYDRQVAMYQVILESGAARGVWRLAQDALTIARNLVALEDAYGYRMMAGHSSIDHEAAANLILDYARLATGHPLTTTADGNSRSSLA